MVANAAIVPAGAGGAVSVYVTDPTDVILDIDGYFDASSGALVLVLFRHALPGGRHARPTGVFGGPSMHGGTSARLPDSARPLRNPGDGEGVLAECHGGAAGDLGYLTAWPTGQAQPAFDAELMEGKVVANAAIVPAGTNESISVFVTNPTDVILDINGYFGPPGRPGALSFYPVTPCRVADTRNADGPVRRAGDGGGDHALVRDSGERVRHPGYGGRVFAQRDGGAGRASSYLSTWPTRRRRSRRFHLELVRRQRGGKRGDRAGGTRRGDQRLRDQTRTHVILDINGYFAP